MILCSCSGGIPVFADTTATASTTTNNRVWIRAKVEYSLSGMSDSGTTFESNWSKGSDGWYYYKNAVDANKEITFIKSVSVPSTFTNKDSGQKFDVKITAEAEQVITGSSGWDSNRAADYSQSYEDATSTNDSTKTFTKGTIALAISEYQLNSSGQEVTYVDNKSVVPGQVVSKIVKIKYTGTVGNVKTTPKTEEKKKTDTQNQKELVTATNNLTPMGSALPNEAVQTNLTADGTPVDTSTEGVVPETGDHSPIVLLICGAAGVAAALAFVATRKKKGE